MRQAEDKTRQYNELKEFVEEERMIRQEVINDLEGEINNLQSEVTRLNGVS
jgi:hypothetical protein